MSSIDPAAFICPNVINVEQAAELARLIDDEPDQPRNPESDTRTLMGVGIYCLIARVLAEGVRDSRIALFREFGGEYFAVPLRTAGIGSEAAASIGMALATVGSRSEEAIKP
jgi:hypothetical protein